MAEPAPRVAPTVLSGPTVVSGMNTSPDGTTSCFESQSESIDTASRRSLWPHPCDGADLTVSRYDLEDLACD